MNSIKAIFDKSDYEIYDDFLNIKIDDYWLDEMIDSLYPQNSFKGLIPTLLPQLENQSEKDIILNRILPSVGQKTICPILMCPDDCDFSCTLIIAEIENTGQTIKWNKLGINKSQELEPKLIGSSVDWFDKISPVEFELTAYHNFLNKFNISISY